MSVRELAGPTEIEASDPDLIGSIDSSDIPRRMEDAVSEVSEAISNMENEGLPYTKRVSAVQSLSADFIKSAPDDVNIGDGTQCSGIGVQANDGSVVYRQQTDTGARTPTQHKNRSDNWPEITKVQAADITVVGTVQTVGRMNGAFGYTTDGLVLVGSLASFGHNWVAKLIGYFERASLPFQGGWQLPNLVLAETEKPSQFHPDASYTFTTRPSFSTTFSVILSSPTPATVGFDVWNSDYESVARIESIDIPEGESSTLVITRNFPPNNGVFNIVPRDAPQGITVKEVKTQPMSF